MSTKSGQLDPARIREARILMQEEEKRGNKITFPESYDRVRAGGLKAVESIRQKLLRGEALTPSEQKVYDDSRRMSLIEQAQRTSTPPVTPPVTTPQTAPNINTPLPPEAVLHLREGVPTTFQNGQTWTLKDGMPVRVR